MNDVRNIEVPWADNHPVEGSIRMATLAVSYDLTKIFPRWAFQAVLCPYRNSFHERFQIAHDARMGDR